MSKVKRITIKGILQKKGPLWTATLPILNISSHGLTLSGCLENILASVKELSNQKIDLKIKIDDKCIFHLSSSEAEKFRKFIYERIMKTTQHKVLMEHINDHVFEETSE